MVSFFFIFYLFERQSDAERETEREGQGRKREKSSIYWSPPKHPPQLGLGEAETRSLGLHSGPPQGWQGLMSLLQPLW